MSRDGDVSGDPDWLWLWLKPIHDLIIEPGNKVGHEAWLL